MHNPRLDREKLDLLHAGVADAHRIIARGVDLVVRIR
jgi:hypothetical protein